MLYKAVAWVAAALTVVAVPIGVVFATLETTDRSVGHALVGFAALPWAALGIAITLRTSGRTVGVLMTLVAFNIAFTTTRETFWSYLAGRPELQSDYAWLAAVLNESAWWLLASLALLLLLFPTGHLPSKRWRYVPPVMIACVLAVQARSTFDVGPFRPPLENLEPPFGPPPVLIDLLGGIGFFVMLICGVVCAISPVARFLHSQDKERAQIKWLAFGGLGVPAFPLACMFEVYVLGSPLWGSLTVGIITLIFLPIAVSIAMLRHDLYDVDRAIAAAVTYALATAVLVVVFVGTAIAVGAGLGGSSALAAAIATGVTMAALAPVRRAAQRWVDRRFFPLRGVAMAAIKSLEQRTHTGEARPEQLEEELRLALRDPGLRLAYVLPGGNGPVDSSGALVESLRAVPISMDGNEIGAIIPASAAISTSLLKDVGRAAGTLVEIVRLRVELTAAVHELEAGRLRLVQVSDEERRRLERDLHDGAQQRLVSLGMSLRLAQRHLGDRPLDVNALIDQTVAELGTAVAELRQIAHGLRPSRLDDGLPSAISALSRGFPVPIDLDVSPVAIPDHLATTIYFVASEALANAVKYAGASRIGVRIAQCETGVEVSVRDDGNGGAVIRHGCGLAGLRDRVAALGGSFSIDAIAGHGTVVHAVLPCVS